MSTAGSLKQSSVQKNKLAGNFLSSWLQKSEGSSLQKMMEKSQTEDTLRKVVKKKEETPQEEDSEKDSTKDLPTNQKKAQSESSEADSLQEKEEESKTNYKPHKNYLDNFAYNKETPKAKQMGSEEEEDERLKKERE
jgi:hypothetical protein